MVSALTASTSKFADDAIVSLPKRQMDPMATTSQQGTSLEVIHAVHGVVAFTRRKLRLDPRYIGIRSLQVDVRRRVDATAATCLP